MRMKKITEALEMMILWGIVGGSLATLACFVGWLFD